MPYIISILVAAAVFIGFLLLTVYESRRGVRFGAAFRYRLDSKVARTQFLIEHIDWGAFTAHLTRTSVTTVAHDAAQGTLMLVRSVERFLTKAVSALRIRRERTALPSRRNVRSESEVTRVRVLRSSQEDSIPDRARPVGDIVRRKSEN